MLVLIFFLLFISGENTYNGDHSDALQTTFSHSSKEVSYFSLEMFWVHPVLIMKSLTVSHLWNSGFFPLLKSVNESRDEPETNNFTYS